LTALNVGTVHTDANDVEYMAGNRRTTPEIQENSKTAQEDQWNVQNVETVQTDANDVEDLAGSRRTTQEIHLTALNVGTVHTDANDVEYMTGNGRTTPEIQENEKTTQEDPWTAQNAPGRSAETERKHLKAVTKIMLNVVVEVVVDLHLHVVDGGGASAEVRVADDALAPHVHLIDTIRD